MRGGRFLTRTKCECDLDLLTLLGVVLTVRVATVFCLWRLTLLALSGARGVAKPSLLSLSAERVSLVGVYKRLLFGVIGILICCMFSLPTLGVKGVLTLGVFFGVADRSSILWHTIVGRTISWGFVFAIELRLICFSFMPSWKLNTWRFTIDSTTTYAGVRSLIFSTTRKNIVFVDLIEYLLYVSIP